MTVSLLALAAVWLPAAVRAQIVPDASDKPLAAYHDKNRVVVVFAPGPMNDAYTEQMKLWQGEKAGFEERQIVLVQDMSKTKKSAGEPVSQWQPLRKRYAIDPDAFAVVLIGKDGHDAFHAARPVTAAALYAIIDAMPMRRAEMKRPTPAAPTPTPTPRRPDLDHDE